MKEEKKLEHSNFNTYPHYVYATAFLVNGELADFKIGSYETDWSRRTFRGSKWENEVAEHFKDWKLTCEYKKILVNSNDEHNDAFELLEMWLDNKFKKYKNINFIFAYERAKHELIEEDTIDIETVNAYKLIEEPYMEKCLKEKQFNTVSELLKQSELELVDKINKLVDKVKQHDKEIISIKEK